MAKKKKENKFKLNKWVKVIIWVIGIALGLILVFLIGFKVWVSTWQTYKTELFSISYPKHFFYDNKSVDGHDGKQLVFFISDILDSEENIDKEKLRIFVWRYKKELSTNFESFVQNKNGYSDDLRQTKYINQHKTIFFIHNGKSDGYYRDYSYWIDSDMFIYNISGVILIEKPFNNVIFYDSIFRNIISSIVLK